MSILSKIYFSIYFLVFSGFGVLFFLDIPLSNSIIEHEYTKYYYYLLITFIVLLFSGLFFYCSTNYQFKWQNKIPQNPLYIGI